MATKIQLRRDTAADWTSANPTLAAGEFGYESDTTKFKIGDGSTAWNSLAYKTGEGIKVVADDSATITVAEAGTLYVQGGNNVTTSTDSAGVLTINATGEVTGSSTTTFTNKTFDAEGTGNALSNIDVANLKSGVLDTDLSSVSGSDDTLASAKAIKAYVDANGGGSTGDITFTGSTINSPSNADITLNPGGTGAVAFPAITINDNTISTNVSNADLVFGTNGTGRFGFSVDGSDFWNNPLYTTYFGSTDHVKTMGISRQETVDADTAARNYMIGVAQSTTLSGSSSNNSNFRPRTLSMVNSLDMAGYNYTRSGDSRGPKAGQFVANVINSGTDASTLNAAQGGRNYVASYDDGSTYAAGDLTVTHAIACSGEFEMYSGGGSGAFTYTNAYNFKSVVFVGSGHAITNNYGYYYGAPEGGGSVTNQYAFYDASTSAQSLIGGVTLQNGDVTTGAISLADNKIKANRSNDSICIQANGTGQVLLAANGGDYTNISTNGRYHNANIMLYQDVNHTLVTASSGRSYKNVIAQDIKLASGQNGTDSDQRWRNQAQLYLDMNGSSSTPTSGQYRSRGPVALEAFSAVRNNSSTASTLGQASGGNYGVSVYPGSSGDLTVTNITGLGTYFEMQATGGDITITDIVGYESIGIDYYHQGGTTTAITDFYHFRAGAHSFDGQTGILTNDYAFFTESASALSQFGAVRLMNQSGDPSGVADTSHIYAKDDGSSSEVYVRDEAGNVTKISPHNEAGEWEYYSVNKSTGKKVRVNMERMIKKLEQLTGETFIESE